MREVLLWPAGLVMVILMGFGKDGKGAIIMESRSQALGALGFNTGILIDTKLAITEDFRMLKSIVNVSVTGLTLAEGSGLQLYLADGALTLAQIEAKIEQSGPLSRHDPPLEAIAERFVKLVAGARGGGSEAAQVMFADAMNNGVGIVTKPRWTFGATKSWNWVIYNRFAAITTGANVNLNAENFGVWVE